MKELEEESQKAKILTELKNKFGSEDRKKETEKKKETNTEKMSSKMMRKEAGRR